MEATLTPVDFVPRQRTNLNYLKICEMFLGGESKIVKVAVPDKRAYYLCIGLRRVIQDSSLPIIVSQREENVYLEKIINT